MLDDVHNADFSALRIAGPNKAETLIRLYRTTQFFAYGCLALQESSSFIKVEDDRCSGITLEGNMLKKSDIALETPDGTAIGTVKGILRE